jgi:serine/threonine protein kinase/WD40 repeat protein
MDLERWQQIDKLLEQVLEREPSKRQVFLDEVCGKDGPLRHEVESLLVAHEQAGHALSCFPLVPMSQKDPDSSRSLLGRRISHYEVLSHLGEGGMGVVYKGRDTHLDRFVAMKVLPPDLVADRDRKRRFVQEAKAASALNHPNIITIHDIASENGRDFIIMEYLDGKTLDQLIPRRGMKLAEALKIAIQIADALTRAHGEGIIHRDLKPGNIMVSEAGLVKVLDFGLAKLTERPDVGEADSTGTVQLNTEEGMILGTASYMSPEQATGKPVDARSDIFSFGSVLYEMVTGQRAFQGDSKMSTLAAILSQEPKSAKELARTLPYDLEKIVKRCLRKEASRRFQHMDDLKVALEELKEELGSGSVQAAGMTPSREPGRLSAVAWAAVGVTAIALLLAAWFWLDRLNIGRREAALIPVPLTAYPGWESAPSFSPDASQVAFQWSKTSRFEDDDIYIKQIGVEGNPAPLTDHPGSDQTPVWSPDGRSIAFARILPPDWKRMAYIVKPQRGGSERPIAEFDAPQHILSTNDEFFKPVKWCAWTPDSKALVVVGVSPPGGSIALFLASLETRERRRLTDPPPESADFNPAVSPDGRTLAFSRGNASNHADLCLLSLSEDMRPQGKPETLVLDIRLNLFPDWTADGSELVFVSANTTANLSLWRTTVSNVTQRHRLAFAAAWNPAVSRQGNRLAYSTWNVDPNIWRVEVPTSGERAGQATKVWSSTFVDTEPAYSPDGSQVAFMSGRSGSWEIWVTDSEGSNPEKLTSFGGPVTHRPRWSPDGQRITFYSDANGNRDVYVMRKDGSELKRLTEHPSVDTNPGWSDDGKWIYFVSDRRNEREVWKVPVEGGEAVAVFGVQGGTAAESPDGQFLYYAKGSPDNHTIWRIPTTGGAETQVIESLHPQGGWVAFNDRIYFISKPDEHGASYIRFKDLASGSIRTIAPIEHQVWWGFTVSPDRRSFLYSQVDNYGSDLMLVENFR